MLDPLTTEQRNPNSMNLDQKSVREILELLNKEDVTVPLAVRDEFDRIESAINLVVHSFKNGGRLVYVGAGTSGRLGILDASECPPTFGVDKSLVQGIIAGGREAIMNAIEGAEDNERAGGDDLKTIGITNKDVVIGIAASGRTPYVIGALKYAKEIGAKTASISNNKNSKIGAITDVAIEVVTGPEVLTGSTRLKAGTAQKLVLNMITTTSMIRIGKVYQNLMVDVQPTNEKLIDRAKKIIMEATGVNYDVAERYFERAQRNVKIAIVMILLNCSYEEAIKNLEEAQGFIKNI
ncbi:N-acetylmuramic acid 6-phosphate etherase [Bacillus andreraoultii]|uniref:N-acetylmuramic acid 6-phosphate etherase n=1 Tax=Bacillus andreraoultii TaxID=1499685 RepID=UPI00053B7445|nr:N-acetylmuramic acid 6-phosphate etherase [Bacillus andreraoultii]